LTSHVHVAGVQPQLEQVRRWNRWTANRSPQKAEARQKGGRIRARLSCLKKAKKVVKLPVRRMGGYRVSVSAYALPQYAPPVDEPQGGLALG